MRREMPAQRPVRLAVDHGNDVILGCERLANRDRRRKFGCPRIILLFRACVLRTRRELGYRTVHRAQEFRNLVRIDTVVLIGQPSYRELSRKFHGA